MLRASDVGMTSTRFALATLCVALLIPSASFAGPAPYVGRVAYERARQQAAPQKGGLFRYSWRVTTGAVLTGALGAGAGYLLGGPGAAASWAMKGAGGGALWRSTFGSGSSGITKHSARSFAKADIQEAEGHFFRKHFYKMKGVAWSAVENGLVGVAANGGLGLMLGGPALAVPMMLKGGMFGVGIGAVVGIARGYVIPFFKRRSLGWSMHSARRAVAALDREPNNPALINDALARLQQVRDKRESLPRLSSGQARSYEKLVQRLAGVMHKSPALASLAAGL
jgi:hypothetical protein